LFVASSVLFVVCCEFLEMQQFVLEIIFDFNLRNLQLKAKNNKTIKQKFSYLQQTTHNNQLKTNNQKQTT